MSGRCNLKPTGSHQVVFLPTSIAGMLRNTAEAMNMTLTNLLKELVEQRLGVTANESFDEPPRQMKYALLGVENGAVTAYLLDQETGLAVASQVAEDEIISGSQIAPWIQAVSENAVAAIKEVAKGNAMTTPAPKEENT